MATLSADQRKKLMVNYLPRSIDLAELRSMFMQFGAIANVHIVKNTQTSESKGYGFVTYHDERSSEKAIEALNGKELEDKRLRVAYSTPLDENNRPKAVISNSTDDVNVYIANIPKTWSEKDLVDRFENYGPIKHSKILKDPTGESRGAGFVRYENSKTAAAAILDMDDKAPEPGAVPLIVKIADGKKKEKNNMSITISNPSGIPGLVLNQTHQPPPDNMYHHQSSSGGNGYHGHAPNSHHLDHRYNPYSKPPSHHHSPPPAAYSHPGAYPPVGSSYSQSNSSAGMYGSSYGGIPNTPSSPVIPGYQPPPSHPHPGNHPSHPMMSTPGLTNPAPVSALSKNNHFCLYIGNLPETSCKSCLLYQLFSPYGAIGNVKAMSNVKPEAGNDHWFAFVNYKTFGDAQNAIQALNGSTLNGRSLKVAFKTDKRK